MGLLNQHERQDLIDLLSQLPGVETHLANIRANLVATLPEDLRQNIVAIDAPKPDIASIVDEVSSDAWARTKLPNKTYPLLVVIKNAMNIVRGSILESDLHRQMNIIRNKLGLPLSDILSPIPEEIDHAGNKTTVSRNPPSQQDGYLKVIHVYRKSVLGLSKMLLTTNWGDLKGNSAVVTTAQFALRDVIHGLENLDRESRKVIDDGINIDPILNELNKAHIELSSVSILADTANVQNRLKALDMLNSCRKHLNLVVSSMDF